MNALRELSAFAAIVLQGWALVFRLPGTLRAVLEALRPGGHGLADREVWVFGKMDAAFSSGYDSGVRSDKWESPALWILSFMSRASSEHRAWE